MKRFSALLSGLMAVCVMSVANAGDPVAHGYPTRVPMSVSTPRRMPLYGSAYRRQVQPLPTFTRNYWHYSCTPRRSTLPQPYSNMGAYPNPYELTYDVDSPICENYRPVRRRRAMR